MKMSGLFFVFMFLLSCNKDNVISPVISKGKLDLIWQLPLREDNEYTTTSNSPLIINDDIVFFYDAVTSQEKMLFVNKKDNKVITRFFAPVRGDLKDRFYHPLTGIVTNDFQSIFTGHNPETMKKIATVPNDLYFGANNNLIGDFLYMNLRDENKKENYVIKVNVNTGDIIYDRIVKDDLYMDYDKISLSAPASFVTNMNDTLLRYGYVLWKGNMGDVKTEILNKKDNSFMWGYNRAKGVTLDRNTLKYKGNMISVEQDSIYCIEPYSGKTIWNKAPIHSQKPIGWASRNALLVGSTISLLDQGYYVEISAENGNISYESPILYAAQSNSQMTYFEGVFYWTAIGADNDAYSYLYGLRASDKKVVLKMKSPNAGKAPYYNDTNFDWNGLQIDTETRLGYTSDGFFAMCFKIPESYE